VGQDTAVETIEMAARLMAVSNGGGDGRRRQQSDDNNVVGGVDLWWRIDSVCRVHGGGAVAVLLKCVGGTLEVHGRSFHGGFVMAASLPWSTAVGLAMVVVPCEGMNSLYF